MKTITDKKHIDRLNEKGIVIEDIFLRKNKELIRRTDGKRLDEVFNATRIRKNYFFEDKCIYTETKFNKISNYTFVNYDNDDFVKCPNCGNTGNIEDFDGGCPYCRTDFNIDYNYKRYDINFLPINDNLLLTLFFIILIGLPFLIFFIFFICMTFNNFLFLIISILLITLTMIIIIEKIPKPINEEKRKIINCLNYELNHYFYSNDEYKDLIDFHIKIYNKIDKKIIDGNLFVELEYIINKYYFTNNQIIKKVDTEIAIMKNNEQLNKKKEKVNIQKCSNCGASIDITKVKCEYCKAIIPKNIEWSLTKLQKFDKYNK